MRAVRTIHRIMRTYTPLWAWGYLGRRGMPLPTVPRRFHAYGVGLGKTGTTSLARVFQTSYRAAHEPTPRLLVTALERTRDGRARKGYVRRFLKGRDAAWQLEMESSQLLGPFADLLVELFPDARFVLTTRDCFTWLESALGHWLASRGTRREASRSVSVWRRWNRWAYGVGESARYAPQEAVLREVGLPPVSRFFAYWGRHHAHVLRSVPEDRLLVVRTFEIDRSLPAIARFVGADPAALDVARGHANMRPRKPLSVLDELGCDFLDREASRHCGDMMARLFPDIPSAENAFFHTMRKDNVEA